MENIDSKAARPGFKGSIPVLGVTGGVGAGKSTVLAYLKECYNARILEADEIGRQVQNPGGSCYGQMLKLFGKGVLLSDGTFDRGKIAEAVFRDRALLRQLNSIVHPAVKAQLLREIAEEQKRAAARLIVVEAALFFEEHYEVFCDRVWYIYADENVRIARLMRARGYSEEKARTIMANQMSEDEFRARCGDVIDNSCEPQKTFAQVQALCRSMDIGKNSDIFCEHKTE